MQFSISIPLAKYKRQLTLEDIQFIKQKQAEYSSQGLSPSETNERAFKDLLDSLGISYSV